MNPLARTLDYLTPPTRPRALNRPGPATPHSRPAPIGLAPLSAPTLAYWYGLLADPEHNPEVRGPNWWGKPNSAGVAVKMHRDDKVRIAYALRTFPLMARQSIWEAIPHPRQSPEDVEAARFVNYCFERIGWRRLIEYASRINQFGFYHTEFIEERAGVPRDMFPLHPSPDNALLFRKVRGIPCWLTESFLPRKGDETEAQGFYRYSAPGTGPTTQFHDYAETLTLRFVMEQEGANYAGFPTQRSVYGPWKMRNFLTVILGIKHERWGLGTPYATEPEDGASPEERDVVFEMLEEYRANERGAFLLPHGWAVKILGAESGQIGTDIDQTMEANARDVFGGFGASFQSMGDAKFGSFALAKVHDKHFSNAIERDGAIIAETLTMGNDGWSPVDRLVRRNYPNALLPKIIGRNFPTGDAVELIKAITDGIQKQAIPRADNIAQFILEIAGGPMPDIGLSESVLMDAERERMTKQTEGNE